MSFIVEVSDDFNDTDGTSISGKATDTGQTWTLDAGSMQITSGTLTDTAQSSGAASVAVSATWMKVSAEIAAHPTGTRNIGVRARYKDGSNYLALHLNDSAWVLLSRSAGVSTNQATGAYTRVAGDVVELEVDDGTGDARTSVEVTGRLNGVLLGSFVTNLPAGWETSAHKRAGLFGSDRPSLAYQWFQVEVPSVGWQVGSVAIG